MSCLVKLPTCRAVAFGSKLGLYRSFGSKRLSNEEIKDVMAELGSGFRHQQWELDESRNAIKKVFEFKDFSEAWSFMSRCALLAEKMDHHPEWFNVYNRVDVLLTTHSCGGISEKDIEMAKSLDKFADGILTLGPTE